MDATLLLHWSSRGEAELACKSMTVDEKPGHRCVSEITTDDDVLRVVLRAADLGALRATVNSILREAKIVSEVI